MSESSPESHSNVPHLDSVSPATIETFESTPHDSLDLYRDLFEHNPDLALWLRRRAERLAPDLADRERQSQLALELAGVILRQEDVNALHALFSAAEASQSSVPSHRQAPEVLFQEESS